MQDPKVILVASKNGLRKLVAELAAKQHGKYADMAFPFSGRLISRASEVLSGQVIKDSSLQKLQGHAIHYLNLSTPIHFLSPSEAKKYKFAIGHSPQDGSIYVQHPILKETYIPPGTYEKHLAKEKEAAFRQLMSALGAKSIHIQNVESLTKRGFLGAKVPLQEVASTLGIGLSFNKDNFAVRTIFDSYGKPKCSPHVPEELKSWVEFDPDLRTISKGRIEGNLLRTVAVLELGNQFGVEARLALELNSLGVGLGGGFVQMSHSKWYFDIEYYEF